MDFFLEIANSIIDTLHLNQSFFIQFLCFLVTFVFLSQLLFKPYYKAYEQRLKKTVGNQDEATKLMADSESFYSQYQTAARELNSEIRKIFEEIKVKTQKESEGIIVAGRQEAQAQVVQATKNISSQLESEKNKAVTLIPEISSLIRGKLLDKEMSN